jgi:hypothetical protein
MILGIGVVLLSFRLINYRLKIPFFPQTIQLQRPAKSTMLPAKQQQEIMKEPLFCYKIIKQSARRGRTLIYLQPSDVRTCCHRKKYTFSFLDPP